MNDKPLNPSAFPYITKLEATSVVTSDFVPEMHPGMTRRDYFAAKALPGAMNQIPFDAYGHARARTAPVHIRAKSQWRAEVAAECYLMADAMLAERAKA